MQKTYTITNITGIHARPARKIVEAAVRYPCDIYLTKKGIKFNAKSLVAMISIGAKFEDQIIVAAEGEHAELAIEEIGMILTSKH
ncbi:MULTISPECIES: HPr family phosphocarrier protein [unclassified Paenibacillus]|uniref:HPr family phosphocarrier protein n=1 Tax=unclassified Paenibacillus TaxID=185978 RepID=UPI002F414C43